MFPWALAGQLIIGKHPWSAVAQLPLGLARAVRAACPDPGPMAPLPPDRITDDPWSPHLFEGVVGVRVASRPDRITDDLWSPHLFEDVVGGVWSSAR